MQQQQFDVLGDTRSPAGRPAGRRRSARRTSAPRRKSRPHTELRPGRSGRRPQPTFVWLPCQPSTSAGSRSRRRVLGCASDITDRHTSSHRLARAMQVGVAADNVQQIARGRREHNVPVSIGKKLSLINRVSRDKYICRLDVNYQSKRCDMHLSQPRRGMQFFRAVSQAGRHTHMSNSGHIVFPANKVPEGRKGTGGMQMATASAMANETRLGTWMIGDPLHQGFSANEQGKQCR